MIKNCVAVIGRDSENPKGIKCNKECEPGYKYCNEHQDRKGAIEDRQREGLRVLSGGVPQENDTPQISNDNGGPVEVSSTRELTAQPKGEMAQRSVRNVVDQIGEMLERVYSFTNDAYKAYAAIDPEDWSFTDKAGTAQMRPEIGIYERALDRETRVIPQVAKLGIDAQAAVIEKAQFEGIKAALTRTFIRMGMTQKQMDEANRIIAEEFSKMTA